MARKRMIDPNIWQSEDFSKLSTLAKLVFIGLFTNADDEGRGRAKAGYLKSILFPYDETMRTTDIEKTLDEIASYMSITFYVHDENELYQLDGWKKWQSIQKPSKSVIHEISTDSVVIRRDDVGVLEAATVELQEDYSTATVGLQYEYSLKEKKGIEEKGREEKKKRAGAREDTGGGENLPGDFSDKTFGACMREFEKCGFAITGMLGEEVRELLVEFPDDWIKCAARRSHDRGKKTLGYVRAILSDWKTKGCMDAAEDGKDEKKPYTKFSHEGRLIRDYDIEF